MLMLAAHRCLYTMADLLYRIGYHGQLDSLAHLYSHHFDIVCADTSQHIKALRTQQKHSKIAER